ncbi:unnamed protein product [Thelazia callipaeda]|uniref:tRNA pseudouridine synthase n=1 Tax=Thelazia callipaeda TaxID=103827 RepID=A0A0N5DA97_THECL|nr:unnamed protein product [Thelazia callipaeda]
MVESINTTSSPSCIKLIGKNNRIFDFSRFPRRRIALMFLYFGWEYNGLVEQREITGTVEEKMKEALIKTKLIESWESCGWSRCGRTDKGVSAFKQVASLIVRSTDVDGEGVSWSVTASESSRIKTTEELNFVKMLNGTLPANIRVIAWAPVANDFNARHQCIQRTYTYAFPKANFDYESMQKACTFLIGEHDFRNFCRIDMSKERIRMSYVRTIDYANVSVISNGLLSTSKQNIDPIDGELLQLTIKASGFLWHQIRCIMALLYEIGCGNEQPEIIAELLDINLTPSKPVYGLAPPFPLCLFDSVYGGVEPLWKYDVDSLKSIKKHILKTWAYYQSLSLILHNMANGIDVFAPELQNDFSGLNEYLKPVGTSTKTYIPIRKRPRCDTLELKQTRLLQKYLK